MKKITVKAFTLVELLVVIAIIGILVALLLPAVQQARESARRLQCTNQVRQMALAALIHEEAHKIMPTGGWGWWWVGDADRGFRADQPGGWIFNIMPFVEESNGHKQCKDGDPISLSQQQLQAARRIVTSPLNIINCPSRRASQPYPKPVDGTFVAHNAARNPPQENLAGRTDYAINCGDQQTNEFGSNLWPSSYSAAEDFSWPDNIQFSGISFFRSEISLRKIPDGTSKTYMIVEKYLNPANYATGRDGGDNETWCTGFNNDNFRTAYSEPLQDRVGYADATRMGSAHTAGFNVSLCDGSAQFINYDIDTKTHRKYANRRDVKTVATGGVR